jgi:uncharacterized membrane protein (UPF0127 family)
VAHTLMNDRTRSAVALEVEVAATRATRRRGLLGRETLGATEGLLLSPCKAVHTVGMRFPIDVIFIDRDGRAVRIVPALAPWRIAMSARAKAVIELAAGQAAASDIRVGDMLYLAPAPPPPKRTATVKRDAPLKAEPPMKSELSLKPRAPIEEHPPC